MALLLPQSCSVEPKVMILTQLEELRIPQIEWRQFIHKLAAVKTRTHKVAKAQARKTRSRTVAVMRRQYFITRAYSDLRTSTARNEDIFIATIMAVIAISYSAATIAFNLFMLFLQTAYDLANITGLNMLALTFMACAILVILGAWVAAFLMNTMSLAIMDGANRKIHRSLRRTFRLGLARASRVANAWLAFVFVVAGPPVYLALAGFYYANDRQLSAEVVLGLLPHAVIATITWVIFMLMQYSLVPIIALFEPEVRLRETFGRSRKLLHARGHLFILFGYILLVGAMFGFYELADLIHNVLGLDKELVFTIGTAVSILLANGIIAMLYRKRKMARKY